MDSSPKKYIVCAIVNTIFTAVFLILFAASLFSSLAIGPLDSSGATSAGEAVGTVASAVVVGIFAALFKIIGFADALISVVWGLIGLRLAKRSSNSYAEGVVKYSRVLRALNFILLFGGIALAAANGIQILTWQ